MLLALFVQVQSSRAMNPRLEFHRLDFVKPFCTQIGFVRKMPVLLCPILLFPRQRTRVKQGRWFTSK